MIEVGQADRWAEHDAVGRGVQQEGAELVAEPQAAVGGALQRFGVEVGAGQQPRGAEVVNDREAEVVVGVAEGDLGEDGEGPGAAAGLAQVALYFGLAAAISTLIFAMVALASPYAIWVLKQASDKLPKELDEAAVIDGASPTQAFFRVVLPLMAPATGTVAILAGLIVWNDFFNSLILD